MDVAQPRQEREDFRRALVNLVMYPEQDEDMLGNEEDGSPTFNEQNILVSMPPLHAVVSVMLITGILKRGYLQLLMYTSVLDLFM